MQGGPLVAGMAEPGDRAAHGTGSTGLAERTHSVEVEPAAS